MLTRYRELLAEDGFDLRTVASLAAAARALDEGDWALVLLAETLLGDTAGLEWLAEVEGRSPGAKVLVVCADAQPVALRQALAAGVYDLVERRQHFEVLLRAKVRNASEMARQRWLAHASRAETDAELARLWAAVRATEGGPRRGRLLADLVELLFETVPGFVVAARHHGPGREELDLVVRNESQAPRWVQTNAYLLVECKDWSGPVDAGELQRFRAKIARRYARTRLGFFVAFDGFAPGSTVAEGDVEGTVVIAITPDDLARLVAGPDRAAVLAQLHRRATAGGSRA